MSALCDIETAQDVKRLVDAFYAKVNYDELLAPIFNDIAQVDWPKHLPTMYRFWQSLLFGSGNYQGAPFPKHAVLPVERAGLTTLLLEFARDGVVVAHEVIGQRKLIAAGAAQADDVPDIGPLDVRGRYQQGAQHRRARVS